MVLVDTSIWINHFRNSNRDLIDLLEGGAVITHPAVIGEIACGTLRRRREVLDWLYLLPRAPLAQDDEVLVMIEGERLWGGDIGWVDAHLIAAARLGSVRLWTEDRRLRRVSIDLGLAYVG